jgi:hypothetical protein
MYIIGYIILFIIDLSVASRDFECRVTNASLSYCSGIATDASDRHLSSMMEIFKRPKSSYETANGICTMFPGEEHDRCITKQLKLLCNSLNSAFVSNLLISTNSWGEQLQRRPIQQVGQFRDASVTNLIYDGEELILDDVEGARYCITGSHNILKHCMSSCIDVVVGSLYDAQFTLTSILDSRLLPLNICFNRLLFVQDFVADAVAGTCSGRKRQHRNSLELKWSCISTDSVGCIEFKDWVSGNNASSGQDLVSIAHSEPAYILMNAVSRIFRGDIMIGIPTPENSDVSISLVEDILTFSPFVQRVPEIYEMVVSFPIAFDDDDYITMAAIFGKELHVDSAVSSYPKIEFALQSEGVVGARVHSVSLINDVSSDSVHLRPRIILLYKLYLIAFSLYMIRVIILMYS